MRTTRSLILIAVSVLLLFAIPEAQAAIVRPAEAVGDFQAHLDFQEIHHPDGTLDLVLLFSVANQELTFYEEWGNTFSGGMAVEASYKGEGGLRRSRKAVIPLSTTSRQQAASRTLYQVFSLTLEDVGVAGDVHCRLEDQGKPNPHEARRRDGNPVSMIDVVWRSGASDLPDNSLFVQPPIFLSGLPDVDDRVRLKRAGLDLSTSIQDHLHLNRRYGVEAEKLTVSFDVMAWRTDPMKQKRLPRNLLLQVLSKELDYALRDTIRLYDDPVSLISGGGVATVTWELDVNLLPTGIYQLSCAPLDGFGNAWLAEFDIQWKLAAIRASDKDQELTGRLVLTGDLWERFEDAGRDERELILTEFWREHDPDPMTPVNEAVIEFNRRLQYIQHELGGMGRAGPVDDRGQVYLYLGPPDEIQVRDMPPNADEYDDALDAVYDYYAPIRSGLTTKSNNEASRPEYETIQSQRNKKQKLHSADRFQGFQLWSYNNDGAPLFPNMYSGSGLGLRFLFLKRQGGSIYKLESSNIFDTGAIGK
jgi:GWxTD domain-containing protein